jgi:phosphohistidine phosphatase
MRHADSGHDYLNMRDHDRPLNARGQSEAPRVADALSERDWLPQLILVSSATRTLETLEGMSPYMDGARLDLRPEIYHADVSTLLIQLEDILGEGTSMILGHNPGSENLINHLTGEWHEMPTAAAALLVETPDGWIVEEVLRPREI